MPSCAIAARVIIISTSTPKKGVARILSDVDLFAGVAVNMTDIPAAFGSFQSTINKGTQSVTSSGGLDLVIWALDPVNNADKDNDGVNDLTDNCPNTNNPLQIDSDLDGDGDIGLKGHKDTTQRRQARHTADGVAGLRPDGNTVARRRERNTVD